MKGKSITRAILLAIVTGVVCAQTVPNPRPWANARLAARSDLKGGGVYIFGKLLLGEGAAGRPRISG